MTATVATPTIVAETPKKVEVPPAVRPTKVISRGHKGRTPTAMVTYRGKTFHTHKVGDVYVSADFHRFDLSGM